MLKSHVFYGSHNVLFCKVERVHELDQRMRMCVTESCDVTGKYFPDFLFVPPRLLSEVPPYHRAKNTCFLSNLSTLDVAKYSHTTCVLMIRNICRDYLSPCFLRPACLRGLLYEVWWGPACMTWQKLARPHTAQQCDSPRLFCGEGGQR